MSWSNLVKNLSSYANGVKERLISFLLQENGAYLLLEDGGRIILEDLSFQDKAKNQSTWINLTKN